MADVAVVSGAGSGIGRSIAERLAGQSYRLALCGRRPERLDETLGALAGSGHTAHPGNLSVVADVRTVAEGIADHHGSVDALVHCAGGLVSRADDSLASVEGEMVDTFRSNVLTAALLTEALQPYLRDGRGRVVATSSIAALRGGGGAYSTAKAALHGWAVDQARRLGERGITVNVVAPGYTTGTEFFGAGVSDERHRRLVDETMVGRAGQPVDVAATVAFLVSTEAQHLTAQVIQVNGGALPG